MGEILDVVTMGQGAKELAAGLGICHSTLQLRDRADRHVHGFHVVTLLLSRPGRVEWHLGGAGTYAGRPAAGDVVVCPAFVPTSLRCERPFESISVRFSTEWLDRIAGQTGLEAGRIRPAAMRRDRFAGEAARKLADAAVGHGSGQELLAESLGTALAVHLLREYADDSRPPQPETGLEPNRLRRVTDHIERHLDGDLSLDRLAAVAGLSPYHFLRRFRASTGTTPHQYVLRSRVERARELLEAGCGIAQAAARAGFSGQSHLHHHVRRLLGVTPGELARHPSGESRPR